MPSFWTSSTGSSRRPPVTVRPHARRRHSDVLPRARAAVRVGARRLRVVSRRGRLSPKCARPRGVVRRAHLGWRDRGRAPEDARRRVVTRNDPARATEVNASGRGQAARHTKRALVCASRREAFLLVRVRSGASWQLANVPYKEEVGGSRPSTPTNRSDTEFCVAQSTTNPLRSVSR